MMDPLKYFCPRLVDYIAIIGDANPSTDSETPQQPVILRRYPAQDHDDFALPSDTAFFCQPEGCTTIGAKQMSLRDRQSFVFALTDKDSGRRRYGTCLNFYRPFKRKYRPAKQLHEQNSLESTSSNEGTSRRHPSMRVQALRSHTLTSLCIVSHHALFDTFRECLSVLAKLIEVCNSAAYTKKPGGRRVHNVVWKYLVSKLCESADPSVLHWVKQLETWIYRLLSSPVPVPGKCHLELRIVPDSLGQPHILALPDETRFSLIDFPLHLPLELLGVDKCIQVLKCIMLEHKVLLMSRDYNALTMSVLALVAMLYPLEYMFPVIPLLPASLENSEQLLYAPTPYIIGIPASFGQTRKTCLPNDVWLFDLDSDSVTAPPGPGGQLPPLPEPEGTMLRTHFKQSLASMSLSSQPVKNFDEMMKQQDGGKQRQSGGGQGHSFNPFIYGNDVDSVDIATRVAMVRFFAAPNILGNIQEHTRILRLYPRPVVGFQLSSFIKSRPAKSLFICKLATTQAVEYYTEWSLNPTNQVFVRVQTGIYDPKQIGDKPRWFAGTQQKISYHVSSNIDATIFQLAEKHTDAPTDESGESDDEHFYPATSDSDLDQSYDASNLGQPITVAVDDVYRPPTELHRTDTLVAPSSSSDYDSSDECNSSGDESAGKGRFVSYNTGQHRMEYNAEQQGPEFIPESTENGIRVTPKPAPRRPPPLKHVKGKASTEGQPQKSPSALISNLSSDLGGVALTASSKLSELIDSVGDKLSPAQGKMTAGPKAGLPRTGSQHQQLNEAYNGEIDYQRVAVAAPSDSNHSAAVLQAHFSEKLKDRLQNDSKNAVHGENQVFLKDTVAQVLDGHGVGWLKSGRVKKLMEDENYRNFVMSRLNTQLDNKLSEKDKVIGDVQVTRQVYKGIVTILNIITHGLEHTYKTNGSGGVASALMVLEVASTHYYLRENKSNGSSRAGSPFGSRESLASVSKDGRATPTQQLQHKQSEQYTQSAKGSPLSPEESVNCSNSSDGDNMRTLILDKSLNEEGEDGVQEPVETDSDPVAGAHGPSAGRKNSVRSPIAHQTLRKISTNSSGKGSPTTSEAINNYSLTVAQSEAMKTSQSGGTSPTAANGRPTAAVSTSSHSSDHSTTHSTTHSATRVYVYEGLLGKSRSHLWDMMQFWEDVFLDGVAQERDIIGLDQEPAVLMDRYRLLGDYEKKHLEAEEDRLLSIMLYNLTAFMVMMQCLKSEVKKKNRRLLGKSHIGLQCSQDINNLLDNIEDKEASDIHLKPVPSRTLQKQSFSVHFGSDNTGSMLFMEVCDDAIRLRSVNGLIVMTLWYNYLVNMTYCPKTKVLCLFSLCGKDGGQTQLHKFHTKKCRDLYKAIKEAMERAISRNDHTLPVPELPGEFPVRDVESDETGIMRVCMKGIGLLLDKTKFFVELSRIKKCFTTKGGIFVLEELDAETGVLRERRFYSPVADGLMYTVCCLFVYLAAGTDQNSNIKERPDLQCDGMSGTK